MSVEAISWVLNDAPDVPPQLVAVLIGLANHAAPDGRGSYPSQPTLAKYARKSSRAVRDDLAKLEVLGLIRRGDQRLVSHLPTDRRPVVWDLVIGVPARPDDRNSASARKPGSARKPSSGRSGGDEQPNVSDQQKRGSGRKPGSARKQSSGRNSSTERPEPQFRQTVSEPTTETKDTPPASPVPPKGDETARGTRLPADFPVTNAMAAWAREKTPTCGTADHEAFCDYWRSVPGAKGRKADWIATWRNWMRREHDSRNQRPQQPRAAPGTSGSSRVAAVDDAYDEFLRMTGHATPTDTLQGEIIR